MGSAFKHGSNTRAGGKFDTMMIAVISQLGYESVIDKIGSDNEIIKSISNKPRKHSALQASDIITHMTINQPVTEWWETMNNIDMGASYFKTFAAMWMLSFTIMFP